MDNLEDFIKKNRGEFDGESPTPEVWKRIQAERKPAVPIQQPKRKNTWRVMRIAASFLILALAAFGTYKLVTPDEPMTLATELSEDINMGEMDAYYQKQVNLSLTKVENLLGDKAIIDEVKAELQLLDDEKKQLLKELHEDTDKKEVVQALMNTYRMKLQVLENILSLLDEDQNEDNQSI